MNKRIAIDGRMINESGIGRYIRNLLIQLQELDKENEYFILHLEKDFHGLNYANNFHKIKADFKWYGLVEQIKLLKLLKDLRPDLTHFPHFNVPLLYGRKFVVTIHDLIHQHFAMRRATTLNPLFYKFKQFGYKKIFKNAVGKSEKILVPSEHVKGLLQKEWGIDGSKIIVTYEAVDGSIINKSQNCLKKFNIKEPYLFYVGNAHPHKNVEGLIKVFGILKEKHSDLSLVLSGSDHYFWQKVRQQFQQEGIIYTGYVSDEELVSLYKNAQAFVMPSWEEGFGIPVLEAMASCCPVVSSNKGSLPEVGGDAAIYFNPGDINDMREKIETVLESEKIRKSLIERGLKRYKEFSWKKLARQTLEAYQQL